MVKFMEPESNTPKLKKSEIARLFDLSSSTIRRYTREINMLSPYRIPKSSRTNHKGKEKTPNKNLDDVKVISSDLKMTSKDLKMTSNEPVENKKKSN